MDRWEDVEEGEEKIRTTSLEACIVWTGMGRKWVGQPGSEGMPLGTVKFPGTPATHHPSPLAREGGGTRPEYMAARFAIALIIVRFTSVARMYTWTQAHPVQVPSVGTGG